MLGSTGSIGRQALGVVSHINALAERGESPVAFDVVGLAAGSSCDLVVEQARALGVGHVAMADPRADCGDFGGVVTLGPDAAEALVRSVECDLVLAAVVGFAGLGATLAAVELGRDVALANKETLVAAGGLIVPLCAQTGSRLLPVDSEHAAVWHCLGLGEAPPNAAVEGVDRIVLTASGGALRDWAGEKIRSATPEQALAHPTWDMGAKVTIDSASLTNKALELIEAHWLFGVGPDRLGAVIQPTSTVHCAVEYRDGSVSAQLAPNDMRVPIQQALAWPHRLPGCAGRLDTTEPRTLEFEPVDADRFPALGLAFEVMRIDERAGHATTAGATFNAANEAAVEAFLGGSIAFGDVTELARSAVEELAHRPLARLEDAVGADAAARAFVAEQIATRAAARQRSG